VVRDSHSKSTGPAVSFFFTFSSCLLPPPHNFPSNGHERRQPTRHEHRKPAHAPSARACSARWRTRPSKPALPDKEQPAHHERRPFAPAYPRPLCPPVPALPGGAPTCQSPLYSTAGRRPAPACASAGPSLAALGYLRQGSHTIPIPGQALRCLVLESRDGYFL
jgi:hypothetical protein